MKSQVVVRRRWIPLSVLVAAIVALVASIAFAFGNWTSGTSNWGPGSSMMGPMMGGFGQSGGTPVRNLDDAARAADSFGQRWGLRVGEVMQFSNGYYAELLDSAGNGATEVLVDADTGAVWLEYGPAMMWNTRYGMMGSSGGMMGGGMMGGGMMGGSGTWTPSCTVTPNEARQIADQWLKDNKPGNQSSEPDTFPGYYTLHTMRGDQITGMLSVHCSSGSVWYHNWHGQYIDMKEPAK